MRYFKKAAALLLALLLTACSAEPLASSSEPVEQMPDASTSSAVPTQGFQDAPASEDPSAQPSSQTDQQQPDFYTLYRDGNRYWFTPEGEIIPEDQQYDLIKDTETGEQIYRLFTREVDSGENDEYGNPIVEHYSALYDSQGRLLSDWEPFYYLQGVGHLVIKHNLGNMFTMAPQALKEGQITALFDPLSGETVLDGVFTVTKVSDGVYIALDQMGKLLGTIDQNGNKLAGFPCPITCYYPSTSGGYIKGSDHDPYTSVQKDSRHFVMDKNLNTIFTGGSINIGYIGLRGPYFLHDSSDSTEEVISFETLQPLFSYNSKEQYLIYFDGELMILRSGSRPNWKYTLCDAEGNAISEQYDLISYDYTQLSGEDLPAINFIAQQGETVLLLDREGKVTAQNTLPGADRFDCAYSGFYSYSTDGDSASRYSVGILDANLNIVIPIGKYSAITLAADRSGGETHYYPLWIAYHMVNGTSRCDLLSFGGELLASNITTVGTIGPDRIAAVRGFWMGLMDWDGNWIARRSIYDSLSIND